MDELEGELLGYVVTPGGRDRRPFYAPVIRYVHPRHGPRVLEWTIGTQHLPYRTGGRVKVLSDPLDPAKARLPGLLGRLAAAVPGGTKPAVAEGEFDRARLVPESTIAERRAAAATGAKVAAVVLFALAAGLGLWSESWHERRAAFLKSARPARGRVVDLVASRGSKGTTWAPLVEFAPEWGGAARFKHPVSSSRPSWRRGQEVGVLYDPSRPEDAMIDQGRWNTMVPLLPGAAAAMLGLLGALTLRASALE